MEDLTKEDLKELIIFYKNKSIDLEFSFLVLQLNNKKELQKQKEDSNSRYKKLEDVLTEQNKQNIKNFTKTIEDLKLEIEKYKKKQTKTQNVK